MTFAKRTAVLILVAMLLLSLGTPVRAAEETTDELVCKLINYFHYYQGDAQLDYALLLAEIEKQDPALAKTWANILEFWTYLNGDMVIHSNVIPDGLPEDDSLCIVVMGYYLKPDGTLRSELQDRLKVTLASAQKYPNAYILCTGGGTASETRDATEAGQMAKWLIRKGVDPDRVITEENALSTIQNATYGCRLLYKKYPQIKSLAVITSDYHIYRSCLYFNTQAALDAYKNGVEPMKVVANATCYIAPLTDSDLDTQVEGMGILTGLDVEELPRPQRSTLEKITVSGDTEYAFGAELDLTVTATYSSGYSREVTPQAKYSGFDFGKAGSQTVRVSYAEDGILRSASVDVSIIPPETAATEPPSQPPTQPSETLPPETEDHSEDDGMTLTLFFIGLCILLFVIGFFKTRHNKKRRRRPKPTIKLD